MTYKNSVKLANLKFQICLEKKKPLKIFVIYCHFQNIRKFRIKRIINLGCCFGQTVLKRFENFLQQGFVGSFLVDFKLTLLVSNAAHCRKKCYFQRTNRN